MKLLSRLESSQMERKMENMKVGGQMEIKNIYFTLNKTKALECTSNGIQMESYLR